jgi:hypothetical protein
MAEGGRSPSFRQTSRHEVAILTASVSCSSDHLRFVGISLQYRTLPSNWCNSTLRVYRSATSTRSLRPGSNGLPLPYGGSSLPGELRRRGCRARTRTSIHWVRASCPAVRRPGIGAGDASRTRMPRGLGSRGLPVASLPRGAPPEARTPFPGVRAQCITRHACGARSGIQESNLHSPVWRTGTLAVVLMPRTGSPRARTSRLLIFTQPLYPMS